MKIETEIWNTLANHLKNHLLAKYDPATMVAPDDNLRSKLEMPHHGFYISINDSSEEKISRTGFLQEEKKNVLDSGYRVVEAVYSELEAAAVPHKQLLTGTFSFAVIWDVVHINNGLAWNENEDGVYFSWGDRYKGLYLPYEIQKMTVQKIEIMNRLCSWESHVPGNLWRLPEGMCRKILADSYVL